MAQAGIGYGKFMEDVRSLKGEGWSDHPVFQKRCRQYLEGRMGKVTPVKFEAVFDYAWQERHSSGYAEVAMMFDDLLNIIEPFLSTV